MASDRNAIPRPTVVGIGASAGGLAALRDLFSKLPNDTGMAFVVVVHLAPDHPSHLADLLQTHSSMPVNQVSEPIALESDRVYVIPPGRNLSAVDSHLRLSDLEQERLDRGPVDHFFSTLADTHDGHSIGVILSGTGSDGTRGLEKIRARGGITVAQDPTEAEYDGMPRNAIMANTIDLVDSIASIADRIVALGRSAETIAPIIDDEAVPNPDVHELLRQIYAHVRKRTGHDLTGYKESTLLRRIRRRMQIHQISDLAEYFALLRADGEETDLLFTDMLISVTSFFRDGDVFDAISSRLIPDLFAETSGTEVVRVWSVGCSTGEEAYGLAMLLIEHADRLNDPPQIQIFASDLHDQSLRRARDGVYSDSIESDVSAERLGRFFTRENGAYRVRQELRDVIVFAPHGLLSDPPFSHLDLIVCRNLLIYLDRPTQQTAVSIFHYALDPGGFLVLGTSESIDRSDLFATVDKQHCLFRRREGPNPDPILPTRTTTSPSTSFRWNPHERHRTATSGHAERHAAMAERYAPPSVLIDEEHRVVHLSATAGRYLLHPGGSPTSNLFELVPEELSLELRTTVHAARSQGVATRGRGVDVRLEGTLRRVHVRAIPSQDDEMLGFVLVLFDEAAVPDGEASDVDTSGVVGVEELKSQLDLTRRRLQTIIDEYETGQEEMRASNEELQSSNEELRSTMEELETSKEELQSMNEELATLNQENRHKVDELAILSSDLQNLLTSTDIATIFLDRQLRIVRFTPPVSDIFNIVMGDRGRPLSDFTHRLGTADLIVDAEQVLERLVPVEREIETGDGRWLLTRVLPYRSTDDRIDGVVITFVDITRRLRTEEALRTSERRLRLSLDATAMGTWTWNPTDTSGTIDERTREILHASDDATSLVDWLVPRLDDKERARFEKLLSTTMRASGEFEIGRNGTSTDTSMVVEVNVKPAVEAGDAEPVGEIGRLIGTISDVTERVALTRSLAQRSDRLRLLSQAAENLLRGIAPAELLGDFLTAVAGTLGLELVERFDLDDAGRLHRTLATTTAHEMGDAGERGVGWELAREVTAHGDAIVRQGIDGANGRRNDISAAACFPLVVGSELLGAVVFGTGRRGRFDDDLVDVLRTFVDYLAMAEQRLRTEAELRELNEHLEQTVADRTADLERREEQLRTLTASLVRAEQRERERIADVLHDDLQQLLYSAQMRLGLVDDRVSEDQAGVIGDDLADAANCLDEGIALTRSLTADLAPPELDGADLTDTITWMADQFRDMHDLALKVDMERPTHVADKDARTVLYRIVRELLFNVVKHAGTDSATVSVRRLDGHIEVMVSDGGTGFDVTTLDDLTRSGRGLLHIRHRVELIGGELEVQSDGEQGTCVRVVVPDHVTNEQRAADV